MLRNKKGAALMQILLITAVLAGMATMLLRASLSRTTSVRKIRREVSSQMLIESCMAEINMMWSKKTTAAFQRDLASCWMNCSADATTNTPCIENTNATRSYKCTIKPFGTEASDPEYEVTAKFTSNTPNSSTGQCNIEYSFTEGSGTATEL